jgi:hypothetical protein
MTEEETPQRKCTVEFKVHIHRWQEESELEPQEIVDAIEDAIEEYFDLGEEVEDEEVIGFEPDEGLDLGSTQERG